MTREEVMARLRDIRGYCAYRAEVTKSDIIRPRWAKDVEALDAAIRLLSEPREPDGCVRITVTTELLHLWAMQRRREADVLDRWAEGASGAPPQPAPQPEVEP